MGSFVFRKKLLLLHRIFFKKQTNVRWVRDKSKFFWKMKLLNLPSCPVRLTEKDGKTTIYDPFRRKNVMLTPEEWVRHHFVQFLITARSFPPERIANEVSITVNATSKRCDTVVYDHFLNPIVVIEYKAPEVAVTPAVFDQIARYNFALRVPYLMVSNGMTHYCCRMDYTTMQCHFLDDIPDYKWILEKSRYLCGLLI